MRHLVFLFVNKLTCPLASELGRAGERNVSSWSKVSILAYLPQIYSPPLSWVRVVIWVLSTKRAMQKSVRDVLFLFLFFYGYERLRAFLRLLLIHMCLDFPILTE